MTWLTRTPIAVVRACLVMLPRLQAEEAMATAEQIAFGTGALEQDEALRVSTAWRREAQCLTEIQKRPSAAALATIGIGRRVAQKTQHD